jgi:hypothetical protein
MRNKFVSQPVRPIVPPAFPIETRPEQKFIDLIAAELRGLPQVSLTADIFVDHVNATMTLRYYFQDLSEAELASLGLRRQGYWLRVAPGAEPHLISISHVAKLLHRAQN